MRALLYTTNGTTRDEGWVELGPIGWGQLIDNTVEIRLTYDDDFESEF